MPTNCPNTHKDSHQRPSAPGLKLCQGCRQRLEANIKAIPRLDKDLELALIHAETPSSDPITHRKDPGLAINQAALEARTHIRQQLTAQIRMVNEEQNLNTWPAETVPAMTAHLLTHLDWLARHTAAEVWAEEWATLKHQANRAAYPTGVRRFDLAPCIEADCTGTLIAVLRKSDDLLPSQVNCTTNTTHIWQSHEWIALGRRIHSTGHATLIRHISGIA